MHSCIIMHHATNTSVYQATSWCIHTSTILLSKYTSSMHLLLSQSISLCMHSLIYTYLPTTTVHQSTLWCIHASTLYNYTEPFHDAFMHLLLFHATSWAFMHQVQSQSTSWGIHAPTYCTYLPYYAISQFIHASSTYYPKPLHAAFMYRLLSQAIS